MQDRVKESRQGCKDAQMYMRIERYRVGAELSKQHSELDEVEGKGYYIRSIPIYYY